MSNVDFLCLSTGEGTVWEEDEEDIGKGQETYKRGKCYRKIFYLGSREDSRSI